MTEQDGRARGSNGRPSALEAAFGRPPGVDSSFAPDAPPVPPPALPPPPPAPGLRRTFGRPEGVEQSFDPPPGAIRDTTPPPESPWWKPDAALDPWRDAQSPSRLGGPPDFGDGRTAPAAAPEGEPAGGGRRRWGLRNLTLTAAVMLLLAGLLSGIAGGVVGYLAADRITPALLDPHATLSSVSPPVNRPPGSIADIAKRVLPVVVSVEVSSSAGSGTGSGVVIDGAGYILTNNHVVAEIATSGDRHAARPLQRPVRVRRPDRRPRPEDRPGRAQGGEARADRGRARRLQQARGRRPGHRGRLPARPGQHGHLGHRQRPGPAGPARRRGWQLRQRHQRGDQRDPDRRLDQPRQLRRRAGGRLRARSSASTRRSPRCSSGNGQSGSIGLGFAIPINEARQIAQQLIRTGKVQHATLGVTARSVTDGARDGALVESVAAGSAAATAGIKAGDVITRVGDRLVGGSDDLTVQVRSHKVGEKVELTYVRGGRTSRATATLQGD